MDDFSWIKVKRYVEEDLNNPNVDWKHAYESLLKHHHVETAFLINARNEMRQMAITLRAALQPLRWYCAPGEYENEEKRCFDSTCWDENAADVHTDECKAAMNAMEVSKTLWNS